MQIQQWLNGDQDYNSGLALFQNQDPQNPVLKILAGGETFYNRRRLLQELTALSEKAQASRKEKEAAQPSAVSPPTESSEAPKPAQSAPPPSLKLPHQGYRKSKEQYPEELHPAFERQNELYNLVNHIHPRLDALYNTNIKECHQATRKLLAAWDEIDEIYTLLDYWTEHGQILPNKYGQDEGELNDLTKEELREELHNVRTYVSRYKNKPAKIDLYNKYLQRKNELENLLGK